nr:carotenoid oxygenase family protein [Polymorphobacter sp.]
MASKVETMIRSAVTKGVFKVAAMNRDAMAAPAKPHPYLSGIHTPMAGELTLESLQVTGTIPAGLNGRYIRIGPNPATSPNPGAYHWFTGDGMVHGVRLGGGKAQWYRNRWIRSTEVSALLGEAPAPGPRNGAGDTVNTNVLGHAGKTWGLVESGGYPVEIGAALETISHNPFEGTLQGSFSAHPHLDPETGEMHAICYDAMERTTIRHVVVGRDGKVRREEPISVSDGPSIHDCMITANYVLIFDLPVTFSMKRVLAGFAFPYAWNPEHKARIGLMPREGREADIIWCDVPPCYVFHGCNAFETEDGKVIADVAVHDSMFAESTQGPDSKSVMLERWTIDPATRTVARAIIDSKPQEFPRFDERLAGKPYRYAYALPLPAVQDDFVSESHYIKHDLVAGTRAIHEFGANRFPGEFMFVPKFAGAAEDEGWLMGYVIDMNTDTTDLMILDAQDFAGAPQAVITIPHRIPPGFHGNWVADGD